MIRQVLTFGIAVCLAAALVGCNKEPDGPTEISGLPPDADGHGHGTDGPHGGHLIELGDGYHAEIKNDAAAGLVTVYLLDRTAKLPVSADEAKLVVNLVIDGRPRQFPLTAVDAAKRDQFESSERDLRDMLKESSIKGRISTQIQNKPYVGQFDHSSAHAH